jgi:3-oxoacyl-[acyl-carrier-protein] synthase III
MSDNAVYITNIAAFLPNAPIENDDIETILGQVGNRPSRARRMVLRSNKIKQRHYAIDPHTLKNNYSNAELTAQSIKKLEDTNFQLSNLDCLACGTSIADQLMPNHAVMVQGELGLGSCEVIATSGVCLSGVSALKYAYMTLLSGLHNNAIATGSELASASMAAHNFSEEIQSHVEALTQHPELAFDKDFLRWMLSDGAGAFLLEQKPRPDSLSLRIDWIDIFSYAGEMPTCMYAGAEKLPDNSIKGWRQYTQHELQQRSILAVKQDVKLLNDKVIHYTVEKPLAQVIEKHQLTAADIDYFVPHYSSDFFRDKVHDGLKIAGLDIPQDRWFTNLSTKGNTGSASIFIMLEELFHSGDLQKGQKILCYIPESGRFSTAFMLLTVA